jgi:lysophospholipase L1-like esterase
VIARRALLLGFLALLAFDLYWFGLRRLLAPSGDPILSNPAWQDAVETYERLNEARGEREAIVFLGDSHTRRFDLEEWFPGLPVLNRGIGFDTVLGLEHRFARTAGNLRIAALFVLIGTNDLQYRSPEETAGRLEALLSGARAGRIIVQAIPPVAIRNRRLEKGIRPYNDLLEAMCRRRGFLFLDPWDGFADAEGRLRQEYHRDGLHLNAAGYAIWAERLRPLLGG